MISKKRLFLLASFFFFSSFCFAQTDTVFWFAAPKICQGHENTPETFRLSSYGKTADITISEPANPAFTPYTLHLTPYTATSVDVTSQLSVVESQPYDAAINYGIKITSTADISAYYEVGHSNNPEIFSLKGNIGTGLNFLIPGQTNFANASGSNYVPQPKNGFVIVATEDNTSITITLSNDDLVHPANTPFTIVLNKGQSYAVAAKNITPGTHLGGSSVKADKAICITIYDDSIGPGTTSNEDLIGDQILPENNNGTEFIIIKGALSFPLYTNGSSVSQDYYYIWATADNTIISINGNALSTINRGQYYASTLSDPSAYIETSNPVYLYQITGEGGEMASTNLPSIKCTGSQLVSFVRSTSENFQLNILCKATDVDSFSLNGKTGIITRALFTAVPSTNGAWMAARITNANLYNIDNLIPYATTTVVSNSSGLFHLGFLNGGTSTGARLGYFSDYSIAGLSPTVTSASCLGTNIQLSSTQISGATYQWTGPDNFSSTIAKPVIPNATYVNSGMYKVQATIPGCLSSSDSILITVNPLPTVAFAHSRDTVCYGSFKNMVYNLTGKAPWAVTYTDGVHDSTLTQVTQPVSSITVSPAQNTIYTIKGVTDSNSCKTDSVAVTSFNKDTVTVNVLPTATILNPSFCAGQGKTLNITLTGKSPWTLIYSLGNEKDTVYPISNTAFSVLPPPSATGTFNILSVSDANGCVNDTLKSAILYPQPHASFNLPGEVCLKDTALFSDNSDGKGSSIVKWKWDFGDGGIDSVQNPGHSYVSSGTDSVRLLVYTDKGCASDTAVNVITVNPLPVAGFSFSSPLCETGQITFTDTSMASVGDLTYRNWNMGNGDLKNLADNTPFREVYATNGNYTVRLAVQNSKGCKSDTAVTVLTIHPLPKPGFIMPEVCLNDAQARFADTSSITGEPATFTYQWNFNAGGLTPAPAPLTSNQKNPVVSYGAFGNYQVSLKVTSPEGCSDSLTQTFTVNGATPKADLSVLQPATLCSNDSVRLQDMSTVDFGHITRIEISWDTTSAQTDTDDYPTSGTVAGSGKIYSHQYVNFQQPATRLYYIRLTAYSGISCVSSKLDSVLIHQSPLVAFSVLPIICNDTTAIQFTQATELTPGGITGGTFAYYGTGVSTTGLYTPQSVNPGTYPITYVYTTPIGCKDSATQNITVLPSPKLILGPDLEVLQGGVITIQPQYYSGDDLQFLWSPSTYLDSDTSRNPQASPAESIRYKLILTGAGNCTVSDSIYITVLKSPLIPNVFSPNGDGINDTWSIKYLNSYPGCTVDIYNRYGQCIFHSVGYTRDWDGTHNGQPLPVGTYYYIINPKNGRPAMSGSVTIIR